MQTFIIGPCVQFMFFVFLIVVPGVHTSTVFVTTIVRVRPPVCSLTSVPLYVPVVHDVLCVLLLSLSRPTLCPLLGCALSVSLKPREREHSLPAQQRSQPDTDNSRTIGVQKQSGHALGRRQRSFKHCKIIGKKRRQHVSQSCFRVVPSFVAM